MRGSKQEQIAWIFWPGWIRGWACTPQEKKTEREGDFILQNFCLFLQNISQQLIPCFCLCFCLFLSVLLFVRSTHAVLCLFDMNFFIFMFIFFFFWRGEFGNIQFFLSAQNGRLLERIHIHGHGGIASHIASHRWILFIFTALNFLLTLCLLLFSQENSPADQPKSTRLLQSN